MPRMLGYLPVDKWEKEVYRQLKMQLPADWVVIANVAWTTYDGSGSRRFVRDGQADFVVLAPRFGMAILEVKGSREFRVADNGCWYRINQYNGREELCTEAPATQATDNLHQLEETVRTKAHWQAFPGLFAYAVVYPQGRHVGELPPLFDVSTLIMASDMSNLEARIRRALSVRDTPERGARFDDAKVSQVAKILTNQAVRITKADTELDILEDAEQIDVLSRQQFAALKGIFEHPRVAVTGPAGSGKTVLAVWQLQALDEEDRKVLYVCFNKSLAEFLRLRNPDVANSIKHLDSLFWGIVTDRSGNPEAEMRRVGADKFFRDHLPGLAMDAAARLNVSEKFDAIIVDEAQDFSQDQLIALLEFLRPEGQYTLFADWRQDVFKRASAAGAVGADVMFSLHHNCRNTERTNWASNRLTDGSVASMPGVPQGIEPVLAECGDATSTCVHAWKLVQEWGAHGGSVAILSPFTLDNSSMKGAQRGHGKRLVTDLEEWKDGETVLFSTIKSFKGLEAASVIVVDLNRPAEGSAFREEDLYVACTRPTARLALLWRSHDALEWAQARLAPVPGAR